MSDISDLAPADTARVSNRVGDWVRRIDELYGRIESWAAAAGQEFERQGERVRMHEPLMQRMGVAPVELDALLVAGQVRVTPVALWVIAGNGRLDASGPRGTMMIVDLAEPYEPPHWTWIDPMRRRAEPFAPEHLLELL